MINTGTHLEGKALQRRINLACGIMFFLYGYDAGVLGGVIDTKQFLDSMHHPKGAYTLSFVAASYTLAAFAATPLVMLVGMKTGRKLILLAGCITVVIGAIVQASAYGVPHIIVGRIICGLGIGFISTTVPVYQSEQSIDQTNRGRFAAYTGCALIAGIPFAYWLDYGMSFVKHSVSWRFPIALQGVFAIAGGLLFWNCPETPRYLYAKNRNEEADHVMEKLWSASINEPIVQAEKRGILAALELEHKAEKPKLKHFFWDTTELKVARRLVICFLVLSFQQLMSVNFLVYYSTIIFSQNGLSSNTSAILGAVLNTLFWIGTICAIPLIDRVGRRGLMLYTAIVCTILMAVFASLLSIPNPTNTTNWVASALIIVYLGVFGLGWIAAPWQYAPEIAPLEYRHVGAALNASGEWLWSFVTVFSSPIALANPKVGAKIWWWYFAFNVLAIPFVYYCCPETANKNLEELDVLFCKDPEVKARLMNERAAVIQAASGAAVADKDDTGSHDKFEVEHRA